MKREDHSGPSAEQTSNYEVGRCKQVNGSEILFEIEFPLYNKFKKKGFNKETKLTKNMH